MGKMIFHSRNTVISWNPLIHVRIQHGYKHIPKHLIPQNTSIGRTPIKYIHLAQRRILPKRMFSARHYKVENHAWNVDIGTLLIAAAVLVLGAVWHSERLWGAPALGAVDGAVVERVLFLLEPVTQTKVGQAQVSLQVD